MSKILSFVNFMQNVKNLTRIFTFLACFCHARACLSKAEKFISLEVEKKLNSTKLLNYSTPKPYCPRYARVSITELAVENTLEFI